jgi:hypothetical protein
MPSIFKQKGISRQNYFYFLHIAIEKYDVNVARILYLLLDVLPVIPFGSVDKRSKFIHFYFVQQCLSPYPIVSKTLMNEYLQRSNPTVRRALDIN